MCDPNSLSYVRPKSKKKKKEEKKHLQLFFIETSNLMESSSSLLHHSYLSYFNPPKLRKPSLSYPSMQKFRNRKPTCICSNKMYVPGMSYCLLKMRLDRSIHYFLYRLVSIFSKYCF